MTANATIRFLARFCREHPLDDKVFLCPSFVVGRQVGESLAREAGSWVNLRFVTPWTLAGEVLERSGRSGRGRPMTAAAGAPPARRAATRAAARDLRTAMSRPPEVWGS